MHKEDRIAVLILVIAAVLIAHSKLPEHRMPSETVQDSIGSTYWTERRQRDSEYWSAFHEGMQIQFREDRGSSEWWVDWERNFDRRVAAQIRRSQSAEHRRQAY